MDKLLAELENDGVPEESDNSIAAVTNKAKKELNYEDAIDDETKRTDENTW